MIDPFVILAPVFLLAVVALLRFVGCTYFYGVEKPELLNPPKITISPETIDADAFTMAIELTVNLVAGSNQFDSTSVVFLGELQLTPKTTSTVTQLLVDITLDDIAAIGPVNVIATNAAGKSDPQIFTVNRGTPTDVFFDPQPPQVAASGDFLNGIYKNLDFGTSQWIWEFRPAGSVISFATPAPPSPDGTFAFANGARRLLDKIIVYPPPPPLGTPPLAPDGTIKLSDGINKDMPPLTFLALQTNSFQTVTTDWDKFSNTINVEFDAAPALPVFSIRYFGPP